MIKGLARLAKIRLDHWQTLRRHAARADPRVAGFKWGTDHYNRIAIVNRAVCEFGPANVRYLEIGCESNICFDAILAHDKTGVDPAAGGTHRMTSDAFFAQNTKTFDVVFIDGLHAYEQVQRDVINSLASLRTGGMIFMHDMLPNTWIEEIPTDIGGWFCGDVWKIAHELNASTGLTHCIVGSDHGVGVIRKDVDQPSYARLNDDLRDRNFTDYFNRLGSMNVLSYKEYLDRFYGAPA